MSDGATSSRKDVAVQFLQLVVSGRINEAYERYVDLGGRHHNPYFPAGFPALLQAMADHPAWRLEVKHVLADGDLVAVHSHVLMSPEEPGTAVVHLFRFGKDRIIEMWDVGAALPADSPNADGAF
ncbi:MAG: nuclear transport factor 2 family protein [Candidatus Aminicenantes bacterium]|nr:nuclear transport factor 2 family protein [Candidatus Aminicenantes bacterium]